MLHFPWLKPRATVTQEGRRAMISDWRYDEHNPHENSFEEALLIVVTSKPVSDMIKMKCREILRDPKAKEHQRVVVDGTFVYIAKTGPVTTSDLDVDSLLIVFRLNDSKKLVQRMFVCLAAPMGVDPQSPRMGSISGMLRRAIARALRNTGDDSDS
jgi:hypothetical protein